MKKYFFCTVCCRSSLESYTCHFWRGENDICTLKLTN